MVRVVTGAMSTHGTRLAPAVITSSGPAAAPIPPIALIAPNARAVLVTSKNSRVVKM